MLILKKNKGLKINDLRFHLQYLEREEQSNSKRNRKKKIINIREEIKEIEINRAKICS